VRADHTADHDAAAVHADPRYRLGTPPSWVAALALVLLVVVIFIVLRSGPLTDLDHDISRQMVRWDLRHTAAKPFIYAFTLFGQRGTVLGVGAPVVIFLCWRDRSPRILALYVLALLLIAGVVYGLKFATERTAPPTDALHVSSGASFPSGHLVNAMVLWWLLAACAQPVVIEAWIRQVLATVAWVGPVAVVVSMTLLDYHWLSDFIAAFAVGLILRWALNSGVATGRWSDRWRRRSA
jgi:membrane-associated phospholipid phosphatase